MKFFRFLLSIICCTVFMVSIAQAQWPKIVNSSNGSIIKIYEPEPESFSGNVLKMRSAISILEKGKTNPVFGTFWAIATVETDKDNRLLNVQSVKIPNIKFPAGTDSSNINYLKAVLEAEIPKVESNLSLDEILASLDMNMEEKKLSKNLSNDPPKIIYSNRPSILVLIDGAPKFQHNDDWGVDAVVNSPFTIIKNNDGNYYLYGGKHWYKASSATGPYSYVSNISSNLNKIAAAVENANNSDVGYNNDSTTMAESNTIANIIVSTEPAELIQTKGEPNFTPIKGTSLLYVNNSGNDIFINENDQQYYVLISGRWYKSSKLNGTWQYVAANVLPADFAKIPEGSPKDNVLASIAGTDASREAIMDAQIPQTAKVDRKKATTDPVYDGDPKFEDIQGTHMQYAINTPSSIIRYQNKYYCVDNGVWFESSAPNGPWLVCVNRPDEVDIIPPSYPVYNIKYVYIYDVTPDWVYMGYTPGYLNTFIYGPTVVYGTGFHYRPWWGHYYYPRAYTWGFGMHYNPWAGWSLGFHFRVGWFHIGWGVSAWSSCWHSGWWGPAVYRPPYRWGGFRNVGYYGRRNTTIVVNRNVNINYTNNIYRSRRDVVTVDNRRNVWNNNRSRWENSGRNGSNSPINENRWGNRRINNTNTSNNNIENARPNNRTYQGGIYTDQRGNVYQRNSNNQWQQRQQRHWQPVSNNQEVIRNLDRQQQMRDRGQTRSQNFQMSRGERNYNRSNSNGGVRVSNSNNRSRF